MKANKGLTRRRRWFLRFGVLAWAVLPGCVTDKVCCNCNDIPCGAIPVCTGTHTRDIFLKQAELAEADDFVIYEAEWLYDPVTTCGTARPGPYGSYHLGQIVKRLPEVPFPVLIQVNVDAKLNEARRLVVVSFLQSNGILDADTRVLVGFPQAEGLFGDEASGIFRQGYQGRWLQGNPYGAAGTYGGAYGGGSFGNGGYGTLGGLGSIGGLGSGLGNIGVGGYEPVPEN